MAGWKNWAALETVTEPDFQGYLQDQVVMRFASAAARDAALGANVADGMICYLIDQNELQIRRTTWKPAGAQRQGYGFNNAVQSIPSNPLTKVNLGTFSAPANTAGRATWTTDGKVQVPYTGSYLVTGQVQFPNNPNGQRVVLLQVSSDGSTWTRTGIVGAWMEIAATSTLADATLSISGSVYLNAGSYLSMWVVQTSGAAMSLPSGLSGLAVVLLGAD